MKGRKRLLLTIAITGVSFVVGYFINFFLTRYITKNIGTDAYGFVTLCKTIASYTVIATTALNSYAARFITLEYHSGNKKKANIYFNSVLISNFCIGLILVILCFICNRFLNRLFKIPDILVSDVKVLFTLIFINVFITLCSTAFQASAYIKDKLFIVSIVKGCSYFVEAVALLVLYSLFPAKVYFVGVGIIAATLLNVVGYFFVFRKYTSDITIKIQDFSWEAVKNLLFAGIWNSFNALGNTLNNGLDLVVSNALLTSLAMGQVSIVKNISSVFNNLYQMVAQPFQPTFLKLYANERKTELITEFKFSMKLSGLISNLAFGGVVAFGLVYYTLWLPNENTNLLYHLTIIAVATSIMEGPMYPLYYIYTLTIKNKIPCIITIIGGLINVLGMYILVKTTRLGIYSIFLTTAVIMNFINGVTNPIYMSKCLNISWKTFYPIIVRHIVACVSVTATMAGMGKVLHPSSWKALIGCAIIACIFGSIVHLLIVLDRLEWSNIMEKIRFMKR